MALDLSLLASWRSRETGEKFNQIVLCSLIIYFISRSAVRRGESDPAFGAEFKFTAHAKELVVGTVYLRIYNSNPTFPLEDPKRFTVDLLDFIQANLEHLQVVIVKCKYK